MITATVGTALLVVVVASSYAVARRRLPYEWWYGVHLLAYAAIALAWFHQIPTGNELVLDGAAADYWRALYAATLALLLGFRVLVPALRYARHRLRVADVQEETLGVVTIRIEGRRLEALHARPGQFFLWRFLARGQWWSSHPFSLSAAPDGRSLRITEMLERTGLRNFAVNAGGDMRLRGRAAPAWSWRVGIQHPLRADAVVRVVETNELAVATSGGYERGQHVLDPHTRRPPSGILSVTVVGGDLATADAYATAAFAMGAERAIHWTARLRDYEAMTILADGRVLSTPGFPAERG